MRMILSENRHPDHVRGLLFEIVRGTAPAASARRGLKLACWTGFGKGADATNAKFPKGIGATRAPEVGMTRRDIRL
jgi:hypothetical protein